MNSFGSSENVCIRYMVNIDLPAVVAIDQASWCLAWSEDDFRQQLRRARVLGQVFERGDVILGYTVYQLDECAITLLRLAVDPKQRRGGIGTALVKKLTGRLSAHGRRMLQADVHEANLPCHLFLRAVGMKAVAVMRGWCDDGGDAYRFACHAAEPEPVEEASAVNRAWTMRLR